MALATGRSYVINGPALIKVKGGEHYSGGEIAVLSELGLTSDKVRITPMFYHTDRKVDDFGPNAPADVQAQLAEVRIRMTLVHYSAIVLNICMAEALGGATLVGLRPEIASMPPAGRTLGRGRPLFSSGCRFISLNVLSADLGFPWRFPTSYITGQPLEIPLGTEKTEALVEWRAIPYVPLFSGSAITASGTILLDQEICSSGVVLFDHTADT